MTKGQDYQRKWFFTIWNIETKFEEIYKNNKDLIKGIVCQKEMCASSKRLHYQGIIHFKYKMRFNKVRQVLDLGKGEKSGDIRVQKGTNDEAIIYCTKQATKVADSEIRLGELCQQGFRTDIQNLYKYLEEGKNLKWCLENHYSSFLKYHRAINIHINYKLKELSYKFRKINVTVLWGPPGSGKSKCALYDKFSNFITDTYVLERSNNENIWFDGYEANRRLVINDFYGWISYGMLLNILDGHHMRLPVKGGFTYALWTDITITSNKHPKDWYRKGLTRALTRRIGKITHFTE